MCKNFTCLCSTSYSIEKARYNYIGINILIYLTSHSFLDKHEIDYFCALNYAPYIIYGKCIALGICKGAIIARFGVPLF